MRHLEQAAPWETEDSPPDIWQRLSRVVFVVVVLSAVPIILAIIWPELEKQSLMAAENAILEDQRDRLKAKKLAKDEHLELIRTNPDYLEAVARDRLGLHKEGEFILRLERPSRKAPGAGNP